MNPSALEIREARAAVERILEALGLRDFVFTIEPKGDGWQLRLECSTVEGWQSLTLPAEIAELRASLRDAAVHEHLCADWQARLNACRRSDRT